MRISLLLNLLLFFTFKSYGQKDISQKIAFNNLANPTTNLFIHFDKNIYANNETAYFTAYLLKTGKFKHKAHKVLAVALIRDMDSSLVKLDKFLIHDGLAFGSMVLPDSILTGDYHFLAYTDKLIDGKPELTFKQRITLKTNIDLPFKGNIAFLEKPNDKAKEHKLLISVTSNDNKFLPKPAIVNYRYGKEQRTAKTDASGQLLLSLPKQEKIIDPNIYVRLKYLKDSAFLNLNLPPSKIKAIVKFFPVGGNLVNNVTSTIAWEVTDSQKKPLAIKAFLYQDNTIVDTTETSSYGIGKFKLSPKENAVYSVKLVHETVADSTYFLPKALPTGLVMNIANVLPQDTLQLLLRSTGEQKVFIRVHNFKKCFIDYPLDMKGHRTRSIKVPLTEIPKGIHTVTITDSLDRPLAEQIFFAQYDNKASLKIQLDNPAYLQREKVTVKLSPNELKSDAIVSIAVVQENRISLKNSNDIETYSYIKNELENAPASINGKGYRDKSYLEQILMVKGWRRYTWQQMLNAKLNDTAKSVDSLSIVGSLKKGTKQIAKPMSLAIFGDNQIRTLETSPQGNFNLNQSAFISGYGKKMYVFINAADKESFDIYIDDLFEKISKELARTETPFEDMLPLTLNNNVDLALKSNEKAIRLKEVTITNKKDNSFNYQGAPGANACGDYVCRYNILNCQNHVADVGNTQPIRGRTYGGTMKTPYMGCTTFDKKDKSYVQFSGISYHKEFYLDDYKDPAEPALFSTIYWNYGMVLNREKETEFSFYTGDITGVFKIIIQGITDNDVVYSENKFEVKNKGQAN